MLKEGDADARPGMNVTSSFDLQAIDIATDGLSAEISGDSVERVSFKGRTLARIKTQQSGTLVLAGGRLQYTLMTARLTGGL